jgi:hypothetical protein
MAISLNACKNLRERCLYEGHANQAACGDGAQQFDRNSETVTMESLASDENNFR